VRGDWPAYAGTYAAARYSPLAQIDQQQRQGSARRPALKSPDMAIKAANPKSVPAAPMNRRR